MTHGETLQRLGIDVILSQLKRFERNLRPGRPFMASSRSKVSKHLRSQFPCTLAIAVTPEYDNQFIVVNAGDKYPVDI